MTVWRIALALGVLGMLFVGCTVVTTGIPIPHPIADAEPSVRCPTAICPRPSPTHSTPDPEPEPTSSATSTSKPGGGGEPKPSGSPRPRGTTGPGAVATLPPGVQPKPPEGSRFQAFTFHEFPFEQAFPVDPPPPPPPLAQPLPTAPVVAATLLAAGVASTAGITARRRVRVATV